MNEAVTKRFLLYFRLMLLVWILIVNSILHVVGFEYSWLIFLSNIMLFTMEDDNIAWKLIAWGVTDEVEVAGTLNNDTDKDLGYSVKLRVPWECLGGKPSGGEKIRCHLRHHYKAKTSEKPAWSIEDVEGEKTDYPSEWLSLTLK